MSSEILLARLDLTKLYPPFLEALRHLLDDATLCGKTYVAVSGFRSYQEQAALYDQGRTKQGQVVTNAGPGFSAHNFGIAVDVVCDSSTTKGLQPTYEPEAYSALAELSVANNLDWGGTWALKDYGHLAWPGYQTGKQLEVLRYCYELSGLPSVFEYLSKGTTNAHINS